MAQVKLDIIQLITIDDNGMPVPPNTAQLLDRDVRELYRRDKDKNKQNYIKECIVIYYLGDPKSPAHQAGLSDAEALKMAIEQADLPNDYIPDALVIRLIKRYYDENIGEAGRTVENILKGIHNVNLMIDKINQLLNEKLNTTSDLAAVREAIGLVDDVNDAAGKIPSMIKKLEEAKQNLLYEKETELSRGGNIVSSSMDAENYLK
jgi:hypothetical protein